MTDVRPVTAAATTRKAEDVHQSSRLEFSVASDGLWRPKRRSASPRYSHTSPAECGQEPAFHLQFPNVVTVVRAATWRAGGRAATPELFFEVDPVSWTPDRLGPRSPRWPRQDCLTHLSSVTRWWHWCVLAVRQRNWLRSLNRRRNRSGTGLLSPSVMMAGATAA